ELAQNSDTVSAKRKADGDLTLTAGGPGEQKVRDIRAGDQQHQSHRCQDDQQRWTDFTYDLFVESVNEHTEVRVVFRISTRKIAADTVDLGLRGRNTDSRTQPSKDAQTMAEPVRDVPNGKRSPHFRLRDPERREMKLARHDADDSVGR